MGGLNWVTPMNQSLGIIQPVWLTFARIIKLGISRVTGRYQSHFGPIQMNQNVRQDMQRLHSNSVQKVIHHSFPDYRTIDDFSKSRIFRTIVDFSNIRIFRTIDDFSKIRIF